MIRDLIQVERSFLDAGSQFSTKPQHWDDSKQRIAEELLIWVNTARTRRLKKPEKNNNPPSSSHHRARRQSSAPSQPGSVRQSSTTSSLHNHLAEVSLRRTLTFERSVCSENYHYSARSTTTPDFTQQSPSTLLHLQLNSHLVLPSSWYKAQVNPNLRV
jgi:hypothetical protein